MAALTAGRNTPERSGSIREPGVKAATRIYAGAMVAVDATDFAVPASTAIGLRVIGRAEDHADNSAGADGAIRIRVGVGTYRFDNSAAADLIRTRDIGTLCYAVDDHTVAKTDASGTRSAAGKIFDVDANGVWVAFS